MNIITLLLGFSLWIAALWLAVAVGHFVTQSRWRRRANARSFDMMVEQYRRNRF
jgi:hypothetical protein